MNQKSKKKCLILCSFIFMVSLMTVIGTNFVWAHTDPPGSNATGTGISLTALRSDGVTPVLPGSVTIGETIQLRASLSWAGGSNAAFERGTWTIVTPAGTTTVTPSPFLPCIGGTTDDGAAPGGRGDCAPTVPTINSSLVPYTVQSAHIVGGLVNFSTNLSNAYAHLGANDLAGVGVETPIAIAVVYCGDGIPGNTSGETCDPPGSTPTTPSGNTNQCRATCTYCGDGIVNNGEVCDDGNHVNGDGCENDCTETLTCGDSIVGNTPGETCDPPGSTPTTPSGNTNTCRNNCTYCGDSVRDSGEQCDDGNTVAGDGCEPNCTTPAPPPPVAVPTMTEWGMIIFMFLAGFVAIYYLRKQKKANR